MKYYELKSNRELKQIINKLVNENQIIKNYIIKMENKLDIETLNHFRIEIKKKKILMRELEEIIEKRKQGGW